jgi:glycosyltransferase involved in cell wall biosynthesis
MAVYNGAAHLGEAVESVLNQSFTDFEFLIVDDGSADDTPEILRRYAKADSRVSVLTNERNLGRALARNRGLEAARGELVAVNDADDVSLPRRLEKQIAFMRANPDIICSGCQGRYYETGNILRRPLSDTAIRISLLWPAPFMHSMTVMRRVPVLEMGGYRPEFPVAQDYDIWRRMACLPGWRFASLDDVLVRYRVHPGIDRREYHRDQLKLAVTVSREYLLALGMPEKELDMDAHALAFWRYRCDGPASLFRARSWVEKLIRFNAEKQIFDEDIFRRLTRARFRKNCAKAVLELLPPRLKNGLMQLRSRVKNVFERS